MNDLEIKDLSIIDFCGTIVDIQTADKFVFFLIQKKIFKIIQYFIVLVLKKISNLTSINIFSLKKDKRAFLFLIKGFDEQYIETMAIRFAKSLFNNHLNQKLIDYFVADNTSDKIIVSAGYSIYIKHFITLLPFRVNNIYASNLLFTKGKFNGEIDRSVYSNDKVKILYEFNIIKNECPISCFTDSISDLPLINLSTKIFCVNPDKQLRALAIEKNWKII